MLCKLLIALSLAVGAAVGQQCQDDWLYFGGSCYAFAEGTSSWGTADEICRATGGKMAEIETSEENEFLKAQCRIKKGITYWIGAIDMYKEGHWVWISTQTPINDYFTDWVPGEPNDRTSEECLSLESHEDYRWNDSPCEELHNFICETAALAAPTTTVMTTTTTEGK